MSDDQDTVYTWGDAELRFYRLPVIGGKRRGRNLDIRIGKNRLQIYVSEAGRSVRVWKNHKELT